MSKHDREMIDSLKAQLAASREFERHFAGEAHRERGRRWSAEHALGWMQWLLFAILVLVVVVGAGLLLLRGVL